MVIQKKNLVSLQFTECMFIVFNLVQSNFNKIKICVKYSDVTGNILTLIIFMFAMLVMIIMSKNLGMKFKLNCIATKELRLWL